MYRSLGIIQDILLAEAEDKTQPLQSYMVRPRPRRHSAPRQAETNALSLAEMVALAKQASLCTLATDEPLPYWRREAGNVRTLIFSEWVPSRSHQYIGP